MWSLLTESIQQLMPGTEHFMAVSGTPDSQHLAFKQVSSLLFGQLSCGSKDEFEFFNPKTKFLSYCLTLFVGSFTSAVFFFPVIYRTWDLSRHEQGQKTINGQLAVVSGALAPLSYLTWFLINQESPNLLETFVAVSGFFTALLQHVQDGRVSVSSSEVLLYWFGLVGCYFGFALDGFLRFGFKHAALLISASLFALASFVLEIYNPDRKPSSERAGFDDANIFSKISVSYATQMLVKGSKEQLEQSDFPEPPSGMSTVNCFMQLEESLAKRNESGKYRLVYALVDFLGSKLWLVVVLDVFAEAISYILPSVLGLFLHSLELYSAGKSPLFVSFYYATLMSIVPLFTACMNNLVTLMASYTYVMSKVSLTSLIYRKAMRLSPLGREKFESSKIMNLINVDADQVNNIAGMIPTLISAPVGIVISTWQLWKFLGPAMFSSLVLYGIMIPGSGILAGRIGQYMPQQMMIKDKRNKLTSNVFRNIKSLKLYAWEKPYYQRIADVREHEELATQRKMTILQSMLGIIYNVMGDVVATTIFTTFLYLNLGALTPGVIFPTLLLLQYATQPFMMLPMAFTQLLRLLTSQTRINELLLEKNQDYQNYQRLPETAHGFKEFSVAVSNATISWNGEESEDKIALKDISLSATRGDLVCITGRVGSGKTAFLKALGGELSVLQGEIVMKGSLAYCTQDSWLQNLSLRDNILFGAKYDEKWYQTVISACELECDIKQMPKGDLTDVGERGISLSGGQKARVALARAVYSRADIYLFDDVLSAVDEHVSTQLIEKVFSRQGILANRTLILATNNVKVLSNASLIVEIASKSVAESATFQEVVSKREESKIYRLIEEFGHAADLKQEAEHVEQRKPFVIEKEQQDPGFYPATHYAEPLEVAAVNVRLTGDDDEEKEKEAVSLSVFKGYFNVLKSWYTVFFFVILALSCFVTNMENVYLGYMSNKGLSNLFDARWYLAAYVGVVFISAFGIILSQLWIQIVISLRVSKILHNNMLWNMMRAPMSFFDNTPLGRLINRFTGDIAALDNQLPNTLYYTIRSLLNVVVNLVSIVSGSPVVALVIIPLGFLGNSFRQIYVPSSRKVARISSAANSPILSQIEESLKGQSVLRTFDRTEQFNLIYEHRVDYWILVSFLRMNLGQWLAFRIQVMSAVLMLASSLSVTYLVSRSWISVGYAAVVIHFASRAGIMLRQTLAFLAQAEVTGVSLERILEYVNVEQEAPAHIPATEPPKSWPQHGEVEFRELSARYKPEGPDVLKSLTFKINGGEKIGIVGRTGSGKSTLTMAIFRMLEPNAGQIVVDGLDTLGLGLTDLRSNLSIIPQDAQIFDGTLRENLDPLETSNDQRLWEVLELCHLKEHFQKVEGGLDAKLSDGGDNLSRGQAQLVCLGRALIHEAKVLVLDEATASVDVETDSVVQETIRKNFSDRTIITIAHRINTIMDSDRILVLDHGNIKEFDTPEKLLDDKSGIFYSLYNASKKDGIVE